MAAGTTDEPSWAAAHREAVEQERDTYIDPETGRIVFTELYQLRRGVCCGSGCRHCPYNKDKN